MCVRVFSSACMPALLSFLLLIVCYRMFLLMFLAGCFVVVPGVSNLDLNRDPSQVCGVPRYSSSILVSIEVQDAVLPLVEAISGASRTRAKIENDDDRGEDDVFKGKHLEQRFTFRFPPEPSKVISAGVVLACVVCFFARFTTKSFRPTGIYREHRVCCAL